MIEVFWIEQARDVMRRDWGLESAGELARAERWGTPEGPRSPFLSRLIGSVRGLRSASGRSNRPALDEQACGRPRRPAASVG